MMDEKSVILNIKELKKIYFDSYHEVLNGIDLKLYEEDFLCILGPSGCGKSTMIRCIAGFEKYDGIIECNGKPVKEPGTDRVMVFQDFGQLFPWKTVLENIIYPLKVNRISNRAERLAIAEKYIDIVNLTNYKNYYPHQLSGGMKQRVAIARGLALKPKLILMDEPFAALDAMTRNQMQSELIRIKEKTQMTVIFITHNIQEAIVLGTRIIVFEKEGHMIVDEKNPIKRPVSPASEGYGTVWERLHSALY